MSACMQDAQRSGRAGEVLEKWRALSMEAKAAEDASRNGA